LTDPRVMDFLGGKRIRRVVYVPRRLVNIVVEG
jgi:leucyl-tRNA synthetase